MATSITNINDISIQQKEDLRRSRNDIKSAPFILKIGNRSNSAHQS